MTLGTKLVFQDFQLQGHSLIGSAASGGNLTLKSTSHPTKGKILFGTSAYDEVNNRLGIGVSAPGFSLETNSTIANFSGTGSGGGAQSLLGNLKETTPSSGDRLGLINFLAYVSGTQRSGGVIDLFTTEAWTLGSAHGSYLRFRLCPTGSATLTERLRLMADGTLSVPVAGVFGAAAGTAPTNAYTALEVNSTTKALLHARMTTTQRDALTAVAGMTIYNSTTGRVENYEGSAWSGAGGAWTAYTPTWTNLTVGNGTQDCAYMQVGKTVFYRIKLTLGSTSSVSASPNASLPVTIKSIGGTATHVVGYGTAYDSSAGAQYPIGHRQDGLIMASQTGGTYGLWIAVNNTTVPFGAAFATSDEIAIFGSYEAA